MKRLLTIAATLLLLVGCCGGGTTTETKSRPYWLDEKIEDPALAAKVWFNDAKFGLFIHFNTSSMLEYCTDYSDWSEGNAEDRSLEYVKISRAEYDAATTKEQRDKLLYDKFFIPNFDAEEICRVAKAANMNYIAFTTLHVGWCYLFDTSLSDFNSVNSPAKRDLMAELSAACKKYELPLFVYVPPTISITTEEHYEHNRTFLTELLTNYGDLAGVWFDNSSHWKQELSNHVYLTDLHQMVKRLQPHALISFKEGYFGDEDYVAQEYFLYQIPGYEFQNKGTTERQAIRVQQRKDMQKALNIDLRWDKLYQYKLREVCTVMQRCLAVDGTGPTNWGWHNDERMEHLGAEEVFDWLTYTRSRGANLLMNIGLRGDGSIHPDDVTSLTEVGKIIDERGWPKADNVVEIKGL